LEPTNVRALDSLTYDMILAGYFRDAFDVAERMIELEPLSNLGYMRKSEALFAAGRDEDARAIAMRVFTEFDHVNAKWQLGVDALLNGDDESAMAWLERLWIAIGQDPAEVRLLVTGARDPENGKAYLDEWIRSAVANAANLDERRIALSWYLPFGYLDDFWRAIDTLRGGIDKGWTNADLLEYGGMVWKRSGFARHPEYMPRSRAQGLTELWDVRGPPDHCSKVSGDWVCE